MVGFRSLRAATRVAVGVLTTLPALALLVASLVDRGPAGGLRFSLFSLALLAFDPFAWTSARNSVIFASSVTGLALVGGVGLGWALSRRRDRGQPVLKSAALSMLALPPAGLALGMLGIWGMPRPWPGSAAIIAAASGRLSLESSGGWPLWVFWIWPSLPAAVALVGIATARARGQIEQAWLDAARLAGAGPFGVWRSVIWPMIRPAAARAATIIFPLALLEPSAPLILGLRRTLPFQIVEAAGRPDPFPRIAVWTALAAAISLSGRWLLRKLGGLGPHRAELADLDQERGRKTATLAPAGLSIGVVSGVVLVLTTAIGWLPVIGLIRLLTGKGFYDPHGASSADWRLADLVRLTMESPLPQVIANSLLLGIEVGLGVLILSLLVRPDAGQRLTPTLGSRILGRLALMPPMVQAVGILAMLQLGGLIMGMAGGLPGSGSPFEPIPALAPELDVRRNPWPVLSLAVGLSVGLRLLGSWRRAAEYESEESRSALDAAILAGAPGYRARSAVAPRPRRWLGAVVSTTALAATNVVPALLFTPWMDGRTVGPALILLADGDSPCRVQAAALAVFAIVGNVAGLCASRVAPAPPPEWDDHPP